MSKVNKEIVSATIFAASMACYTGWKLYEKSKLAQVNSSLTINNSYQSLGLRNTEVLSCETSNSNSNSNSICCDNSTYTSSVNGRLSLAVWRGQLELVKLLISQESIDINSVDEYGNTAIVLAAMNGHIEIIKYLTNHGGNIHSITNDDCNAVIVVAMYGQLETLTYLISQGVNSKSSNSYGYTALMVAVENNHTEIVKYLISVKADCTAVNVFGSNSITIAAACGHLEIIKILDQHGVNYADKYGYTALMVAAKYGFYEVVRYLLGSSERSDINSSINYKNILGFTAMMLAAQSGHLEIVQLLHSYGATIDSRSNQDLTAIMLAAETGHITIVEFLVSQEANIFAVDKYGNNALMLACKEGHLNVVEYLHQHGIAIDIAMNIIVETGNIKLFSFLCIHTVCIDTIVDILDMEKESNSDLVVVLKKEMKWRSQQEYIYFLYQYQFLRLNSSVIEQEEIPPTSPNSIYSSSNNTSSEDISFFSCQSSMDGKDVLDLVSDVFSQLSLIKNIACYIR